MKIVTAQIRMHWVTVERVYDDRGRERGMRDWLCACAYAERILMLVTRTMLCGCVLKTLRVNAPRLSVYFTCASNDK